MPPFLRVEVAVPGERVQEWAPVAELRPGDQPGTISDNRPDGRDVYLFGADVTGGYVKRSEGGVDVETSRTRVVHAVGFTSVASLAVGESHELTVTTPSGKVTTLRFTCLED